MKIVSAEYLCSAEKRKDYPSTRVPEIAFAGRSNVGKSSMINSLLGRKNLVRTSKTPGLTRKINFFLINKNLMFVDLPGYGYASVPMDVRRSWAPMVNTYLTERKQLAGVVVIIDSRREPTELDESMINFLKFREFPFLLAISKADKVGHAQRSLLLKSVQEQWGLTNSVELFSSITGLGRKESWSWIIGSSAKWRASTSNSSIGKFNSED